MMQKDRMFTIHDKINISMIHVSNSFIILIYVSDCSISIILIIMGNAEFPSQFSQKEIQKLYARFKQIDEDNSGDLDPDEIFNVPELNQNPLVKRVISIFDKNKDGKISFS